SDVEDVFNLSYQWTLNGEAVAGANTLQLSLTSLTAADQISCLLRYDNDCTVGNEITADPINAVIETAVTPSLFLQASANTICAGTQVSFSASGSHWGAQPQFSWQIDGNPVGQNSPTFATDALLDGQTVTCVLNVEETCVSTSTVTAQGAGVTVLPALDPTISISANTNRICVSTPVTFTAAGSHWGTQAQLRWMIDQVPVSGEQATTFTTSDLLPNQSVSCAVISNADCSPANEIVAEPISIEVDMGDTPTVQISADNDQVCSGTAITFTASGEHWGTQANFQWWVDGQMVGDNRPTFQSTALLDGQIVRCTVLSSQECVSTNEAQSNALTVTIAALEIAVEEVLSETCQLANGWIEVGLRGGVAPFEFAWSNGGSESFISDLKAGDYDLTVTDATGCSATIQVVLPAEDQPSIDQLAIQQPVCQAERGRANVTMSNDGHEYTYRWLDDNNFIRSKSAEVEGLDAGVYHLEITNEYGCSTRETFHIQPASSLEVSTTLERQVILGAQTRLNAAVNTNAAVSFEWFPSAGLSCTDCEDPMVAPTASTVYTVVVTNEWGCSAESSVIVKVIPNDEVYVPNAFSPNGDGINDFFTVFGGSHVASIKSMRIIDRWGATLFAGTDLPINSERTGWNGSANGKTLRTGVYVYQVEIQFIDGKTKVLQGDLTLVQ
ncbi:MAG: gliding motility-associated C-terminal domain-containing protein, partial [Bacteroidota bacterium]